MRQVGVVAAGLAIGVGGIAAFDRDDKTSYRPHAPSVSAFSFSTSMPEAPPRPPEAVPTLAAEPADAPGAVAAFLQLLAEGRPEMAYPLLDEPSRRRFTSATAWAQAQVDRAQPVTFEVGASQPSRERRGAVEVEVSATHRASLDSIRGLVPARSSSTWLVRREGDAWRVSGDPESFRPVLPAEEGAKIVVQSWVSLLAACDASTAAQLQVSPNLYGPSGLVAGPCEKRGAWTAGEPVGLDRAPDPRTFLAAFGPGVGAWARLVPVQGPESKFLAAVAPMGDGWQVMGVAAEVQ